ncbi:H-2 class I histocompatibility antigen, Q10 alpha chain isoform X2 [Bubalus bubalis]|uniref:H-2 class I histocompatibility antigen, Q10 alpha chain isoform X2 n=1 Tax=Bubalus bubalis TaxID=89462 RepID=UPI001D10FD53|nr:H-2 class I histocompatibility antigen, Q10 alpha chain isoform X2 [Bubalus bubalis]
MVAPSAAQRELSAHPPGTREGTRPELAQLKADPPGTGALGRCVRLATVWLRSSGSARHPRPPPPPPPPPPLLRLLLLLSGLVRKGAAESPWGLPLVADGPASMAKVVMAELANLKLENKSWPRVCVSTGTHSLRYHYLDLSEPGPSLPKFLAVGYVDDQPFIRYDSRVDKAEPQAPWIIPMNAKYWEKETKKQRKWAEIHKVVTWQTMGYHNHSSGMHSTHRMFGCEIQEDGQSSSFWQFGYDGQDHVSLDMETLSWVSANPVALLTKRRMETEHCYAEYNKAYLEGPCLASLRRYLELGGQRFTRREPPTVRVTKHSAQDGGTTLRCWALGFYPQDISLSWWLGEKKLNSKLEYVEARPSGDGTYQMWMAVWVPAGDETQYTCHVQHCSLNHTLTVSWEMPSHPGLMAMVISLILILLVIGGGVSLTKCLQARNKEPYEQPPD